jgi:hypothetical protein
MLNGVDNKFIRFIIYSISSSAKVVTELYEKECSACAKSVVWTTHYETAKTLTKFAFTELLGPLSDVNTVLPNQKFY